MRVGLVGFVELWIVVLGVHGGWIWGGIYLS